MTDRPHSTKEPCAEQSALPTITAEGFVCPFRDQQNECQRDFLSPNVFFVWVGGTVDHFECTMRFSGVGVAEGRVGVGVGSYS